MLPILGLEKLMKPNTAFSVMVSELNSLGINEMSDFIEAIQTEVCIPQKIPVMALFTIWSNMEPINA